MSIGKWGCFSLVAGLITGGAYVAGVAATWMVCAGAGVSVFALGVEVGEHIEKSKQKAAEVIALQEMESAPGVPVRTDDVIADEVRQHQSAENEPAVPSATNNEHQNIVDNLITSMHSFLQQRIERNNVRHRRLNDALHANDNHNVDPTTNNRAARALVRS